MLRVARHKVNRREGIYIISKMRGKKVRYGGWGGVVSRRVDMSFFPPFFNNVRMFGRWLFFFFFGFAFFLIFFWFSFDFLFDFFGFFLSRWSLAAFCTSSARLTLTLISIHLKPALDSLQLNTLAFDFFEFKFFNFFKSLHWVVKAFCNLLSELIIFYKRLHRQTSLRLPIYCRKLELLYQLVYWIIYWSFKQHFYCSYWSRRYTRILLWLIW